MKACPVCGKKFRPIRTQVYCGGECAYKAKIRREEARNSEYKKYVAPTRKQKKPKLTLAQINELARAEGLNYGAYCAKHGLYK